MAMGGPIPVWSDGGDLEPVDRAEGDRVAKSRQTITPVVSGHVRKMGKHGGNEDGWMKEKGQ